MDEKYELFKSNFRKYKKFLSQYKLYELLILISQKSIELCRQSKPMILEKFSLINKIKNELIEKETWVTAWDLVDLSYDAICFTNDLAKFSIRDPSALQYFCGLSREMRDKRAELSVNLKKLNQENLYLYIFSFAGEQAKFQSGARAVINNLLRDLYIIFEIGANKFDFKAQEIISKEIGCDYITAIGCFYMMFGFSFYSPIISDGIKVFPWENDKIKKTFCEFIQRYSCTYEEVRTSQLKRQIFYIKPFVYTQQGNKLICVNCYLSLFALEHGIYWIIRDYYNKNKSQEFVNNFGEYFEFYFEDVLNEYLEEYRFKRIKKSNTEKRCDWIINLFDKTILIEQKSSLVNLSVKQQDTDLDNAIKFIKSTLGEATEQLDSTEKYLNKKCIKIILIYDDYFISSISRLNSDLSLLDKTTNRQCWIMTISEFETLIYLYKNDRNTCENVLNEKIIREEGAKKGDCSFSTIFREKKIVTNFFANKKFDKFKELFDKSVARFNKGLTTKHE